MKLNTLYFVRKGKSLYRLASDKAEYVCVASVNEYEIGTYLINPDLYRRENGNRVNVPVETSEKGMNVLKKNKCKIFM